MGSVVDMIGKVIGRLSVKGRAGSKKGKAAWLCLCACGNEVVVSGDNLRTGHTKSCGCVHKEVVKSRLLTHSMTGTKEYNTWLSIKSRTTNPENQDYAVYSRLGIEEEWKSSFLSFLGEIGNVPNNTENWSIGRIDNTIGYFKGNVRWESAKQQARNKGMYRNNSSGETGIVWREDVLKNGCKSTRAVAYYQDECGKKHSKSFRVKEHGLLEAFYLAVIWREDALQKLTEQGAGYSQQHGK